MARKRTHAATYDPREIKENIVDTPLQGEMSKSFLGTRIPLFMRALCLMRATA